MSILHFSIKTFNRFWKHTLIAFVITGAFVAMGLRYPDEVRDASRFAEIKNLLEPSEEELGLDEKIVDKLTVDLDLSVFIDSYREKIEAMISSN